jgi:hypothetical protein
MAKWAFFHTSRFVDEVKKAIIPSKIIQSKLCSDL